MKKFGLLLATATLALVACETTEEPKKSSFPTDGLTVEEKQRVLVLEQTGAWCQYCPNGAEKLIVLNKTYGKDIIGLAVHNGDDITVAAGGLLDNNFPFSGVPNFYVMNEDAGQSPEGKINNYLSQAPLFGVAHSVVTTDTAYNVYAKVKLFDDSYNEDYLINSYLVLDAVLAKDYGGGIDLNQTSSVPIVQTGSGNTPSKWAMDAAFVDGQAQVKAGENYYHLETFYTPANTPNPWGKPLAEVNPFGKEYINGDILGTKNTPILLSIPRTNLAPFETGLSVVTIVWRVRTDGSGSYDYVNGYISHISGN